MWGQLRRRDGGGGDGGDGDGGGGDRAGGDGSGDDGGGDGSGGSGGGDSAATVGRLDDEVAQAERAERAEIHAAAAERTCATLRLAADSLQRAKDNLQLERDAALQNAANEHNRLDAQVRPRDRGSDPRADRDLRGQGARVRACRECRDRLDLKH